MKKLMLMMMVILVLCFMLPAEEGQTAAYGKTQAESGKAPASTPAPTPTPTSSMFLYAIYLGIIGLTAAAISGVFAQSKALRTAVENIGRNPSAADSIRGVVIIGLALIESLVIYVLLVNLILFFVKWNQYTF